MRPRDDGGGGQDSDQDTISTCHTDSLKYETMKNLIVQRNIDLTKLQDNKKI